MASGTEIDWTRLAEAATGLLGWTPDLFWAATPAEFWTAWDGWVAAFHRQDGDGTRAFLGSGELAALMTRFPDPSC